MNKGGVMQMRVGICKQGWGDVNKGGEMRMRAGTCKQGWEDMNKGGVTRMRAGMMQTRCKPTTIVALLPLLLLPTFTTPVMPNPPSSLPFNLFILFFITNVIIILLLIYI